LRQGDLALAQRYRMMLTQNQDFQLCAVTEFVAEKAAELRARHNLRTPDALHVATAIEYGCDTILTNDRGIARVSDIRVLILDDLKSDPPKS
jgi:predicted nucleic acid-binding protein